MKALILHGIGDLRLDEVAIPVPGKGEVLVKVKAATTCGTDLKAFLRGHPQIPMPGPLGHEYSGVVDAVGEDTPFQVGDAVMGVHSAPCQRCKWCLADQENLCESIMSTKVLGSFAEYLLIPARIARLNLFLKPPSLNFETAALLEPLACVAQGILEFKKSGLLPTENALVIGPGAIGLMFVAALKASGAASVTLAGRNELRLQAGEVLGATIAKWPDQLNGEFDLVVECTGQVEVWERSVDYSRRGGTVMLFGGPPGGSKVQFFTHRLHYDQISLVSPFHFGTEAVKLAYRWLTENSFDISGLITERRGLEESRKTFTDLIEGRGIKYVFTP